jgi:flagellar motor switch protein FliN/FliY
MSDPNRHPTSQNPRPSSPPRPSLAEAIGLTAAGHPPRNESPSRNLEALGFVMDVPVELTVEIGRKNVKISDILRLGPGSVVELTKDNGEPLDIYVNNRLVARGEAVVVGERYGVRLTEVLVGDPGPSGAREV